MKAKFFIVAFFWFSHLCLSSESNISLSTDLVTPTMTQEDPTPGKRVSQVAHEYKGTKVYHTLYLPTDGRGQGSEFGLRLERGERIHLGLYAVYSKKKKRECRDLVG